MAGTSPKSIHFLLGKTIVISGAGIAGLAFSISLHKLWPSISSGAPPRIILYERDPCAVPPNREGYSLSLRSDPPSAGIQTLQKMGILDRLLAVAVSSMGGDENEASHGKDDPSQKSQHGFCVWDKDWNLVMKVNSRTQKGCPVAGMRIHRSNLRRTLAQAVEELPDVEIHWGSTVVSVSPTSDSQVEVQTSSGGAIVADLVLAADGSSSKLRALLRPADILHFAGPTSICGKTTLANAPDGNENEFGSMISGEGLGLFIAPVSSEEVMWNLSWREVDPLPTKRPPLSVDDAKEVLEQARQKGEHIYGPRFAKVLQETDLNSVNMFNAMDKQPFAHSSSPSYIENAELQGLSGKVVFLGDANHAVSPFAGNGANLALMDGWDFAESLVLSGSLEEAEARYDRLAVGRAKKVIRISHFSIMVMHSTGWMTWFWMQFFKVVRWLFYK